MTSFFSHRPFSCFNMLLFGRVGQIRSWHRYRGPKSLHFDKFTMLSLLFLTLSAPEGEPNSIANFDGAMVGFAPRNRHCIWSGAPIPKKRVMHPRLISEHLSESMKKCENFSQLPFLKEILFIHQNISRERCIYNFHVDRMWTSTRESGSGSCGGMFSGGGGSKSWFFCGRHKWMAPRPKFVFDFAKCSLGPSSTWNNSRSRADRERH